LDTSGTGGSTQPGTPHVFSSPITSPARRSTQSAAPLAVPPPYASAENLTTLSTASAASAASAPHLAPTQEATTVLEPLKAAPADKKCTGPNCVNRVDPLWMCSTCSYYYCKTCCQKYQTARALCCKEPRHANVSETNSDSSTIKQQTNIQCDNWYDSMKPLTKEHYDAQQHASQKYHHDTSQILEIKWLEEHMKKDLNLVFWKEVRLPISIQYIALTRFVRMGVSPNTFMYPVKHILSSIFHCFHHH